MIRFLFFVFSLQLIANAITVNIDKNTQTLLSDKYTLVYIDENSSYEIQKIFEEKNNIFKIVNSKEYTYTKSTIWTYFSLDNLTNDLITIIAENPWSGIDYMDIYLFQNSKQIAHYIRGDANKQEFRNLLYGNSIFPISLNPNEKIDVFIKYKSYGAVKTTLLLQSQSSFIENALFSSRLYAFIFGVLTALLVYNLTIYFSIKEKVFLIYVFYGIFNIILLSTTNGYLYELNIGIYGDNLSLIGSLATNFISISLLLMLVVLYDLKKHSKIIYYFNLLNVFLLVVFSILNFSIIYRDVFSFFTVIDNYINQYLILFTIFTLLVNMLFGIYKKFAGSYFVLMGISLYLFGAYTFLSYLSDNLPYSFFNNHANALGIFGDMIFISIALSKKVENLKQENDKARILLFRKSKFDSLGNVLAGVIHQLKNPINYVSSTVTFWEAKERAKGELNEADAKLFSRLNSVNKEINTTLDNVYDLYSPEKNSSRFDLNELIENNLELLSTQLIRNKITIKKCLQSDISKQIGYPNKLKHILLIILENAMYILKEREIINPQISIKTYTKNQMIYIEISDNAGGIGAQNLEKIFDLHFTTREKGTGIGLSLAKDLMENILNGTIEVSNTNNGANFKLSLPIK